MDRGQEKRLIAAISAASSRVTEVAAEELPFSEDELKEKLYAEERSMREAELAEAKSAISGLPSRAGPTLVVAAASIGFLTSLAAMGDLAWIAELRSWQLLFLVFVAASLLSFVMIAMYLALRTVPPELVTVYEGPSSESENGQGDKAEEWPGFAEEARRNLMNLPVGRDRPEKWAVDEYMAMMAYGNAVTLSEKLKRHRRQLRTAANCVMAAAVLGGMIVCIEVTVRIGMASERSAAKSQSDGQVENAVIIHERGVSHHVQEFPSSDKESRKATGSPSSAAPEARRNSGPIQRKGVHPIGSVRTAG